MTVGATGSGAVVFAQLNGDSVGVIKMRRFNANGVFSPTTTSVSNPADGKASQPSVGIGGDGMATMAWITDSTPAVLRVKRIDTNGGEWGADTLSSAAASGQLCATSSSSCASPMVFSRSTGISTVVWLETLVGHATPSIRTNQISTVDVLGTTPKTVLLPQQVARGPYYTYDAGLQGRMTTAGAVQLVWLAVVAGNHQVESSRITTTGTPATVQTLSPTATNSSPKSNPDLSVNASGAAVVAWADGTGAYYRRLSTGGSIPTHGKPAIKDPEQVVDGSAGNLTAGVLLTNSGVTYLVWLNQRTQLRTVVATAKDYFPRHSRLPVVAGVNDGIPLLAQGPDGTISATWLHTGIAPGAFPQLNTEVFRNSPKVASVKFPSLPRSRQRIALIKFTSTKGGSALITIEGASRSVRFRKVSTRAAVLSGSSTVRFNTTGLVKGNYKVTIVLVDAAGLSATKTTRLIVTH